MVIRRLEGGASRAFRRVVERIRARLDALSPRPIVSVVTPFYNVEPYIAECLDSVLGQDYGAFEVIAVDDGSTDGSAAIVDAYAARDRRIRTLRQANSGQGPARNLAIAHARGEFLVFVDSDDVVPPGSFGFLVSALRRSGSDFAVAGVRRLEHGRSYRPSWTVVMLEHDRIGIRLDDFPAAMADVVAHHRIFRRRFWTERIGGFPSGAYEDHAPMVAAYLRARRFDLLTRVVYEWRLRAEGTSTGQQKHALANLEQRIAVKARTRKLVEAEASPAGRAAWVGRVLDIDFAPYIDHALRADDAYRRRLAEALAAYVGRLSAESRPYVRVQQKVRTWLASRGRWDALEVAQRYFRELGSIPPTVVRDGRVTIGDPRVGGLEAPIPREYLELAASESRLQACALRAEWIGSARLRLTGWALIRGIDLTGRTPRLTLSLIAADGSARRELPVEPVLLREATRWVNWAHGSFDRAGFRTTIDMADIVADADAPREWHMHVRVEVGGVVREGGLHHAVAGSSASRAAIAPESPHARRRIVVPRYDGEHGFTLSVRRPGLSTAADGARKRLQISGVRLTDDAIVVECGGSEADRRSAYLSNGEIDVAGALGRGDGGHMTVRFPTRSPASGRALPSGDWAVLAGEARRPAVVAAQLAYALPSESVGPTHRLRVAITGRRELRIELSAPLADDELGARAQQLQRDAHAVIDSPAASAALFIPGEVGRPSAALGAIHVQRRRAGIPSLWSVPDLAADLPDDAEPVVFGSRAWYASLSSSTLIVSEDDLEPWFRKRPHQRIVRIFTQAPGVPVGRAAWWAAGHTPGRIAAELARIAICDAIVIPAAADEARYREELDFRGAVHAADTPAERILAGLTDTTGG